MISRRALLTVIGGTSIAAAGATLWALTRDPHRARAPWGQAGQGEADPRRKALSYAILAPNPHNRQPWLADLSVANEITLFCDGNRRLPQTDPFDRQITIGLGAFLELLSQAAAEDGWRTDIAPFPDGEPQPQIDDRPVARIRFIADPAVARDPLFAHVLRRRTNRQPFDTSRPVALDKLRTIATAARSGTVAFTHEPAKVAALRARAWEAMHLEISTYETAKESIDLMRIGRAANEANPDGISITGPLLEGLSLAGIISRETMLDPSSSTFRQQVAYLKTSFDTATAFLWLVTPGNGRIDQLQAGRNYVRLNLAATAQEVMMQPFSQALQEFPVMRPHYVAMREALGVGAAETLQMFVRVGYGPAEKPSPRWPAATRIKPA